MFGQSVRLINKPIFFKIELSKYIPGRPLDIFIIAPPKIGVLALETRYIRKSFTNKTLFFLLDDFPNELIGTYIYKNKKNT